MSKDNEIKYLDVNKEIINAIFLLDGDEETVRKKLNEIIEKKGEVVEKKKTTTRKKKEETFDISKEVPVSPKRQVYKKLFKNKDYSK